MRLLEFFADVNIVEGETDERVESMKCIDKKHSFQYYFVIKRDDKFYFQYINITSKTPNVYNEKFEFLKHLLCKLPDEEICVRVKLLMSTELQNFHRVDEPLMRNPFISIRGTCKKRCLPSCKSYGKEYWCKNKVLGFTGTVYKYPDIMEIFEDIVEWYCACPGLDMVFVMHDYYPADMEHLNFEYTFHVKDRVIKMVDSYDAKKLYKEYNEKYPIDLKDVDEWIEYMKS